MASSSMGTCDLNLLCEGWVQQAGLTTRASLLQLTFTPHFFAGFWPLPLPHIHSHVAFP